MDPLAGCAFAEHFAGLPDPRIDRRKRHELLDVVTIALGAVVCGANTWVGVAEFGRSKEPWRRAFLALPHGIPSHDTFGRVFAALDPTAFEAAFLGWVRALAAATAGQAVAIDGKTLRRSHDRSNGRGPPHPVRAWAGANRLVLGQVAVDDGSNGLTAIPALLEVLARAGCVVAIDAMGCPQEIAGQIVARAADYVLALEDNPPTLHELVGFHFARARETGSAGIPPGGGRRSRRTTGAWRSGAAGRPTTRRRWRGSTPTARGRVCAAWRRWRGSAASTGRSPRRPATT